MELTLHIILNEIESKFGMVSTHGVNLDKALSDVRLYDGRSLEPDFLYIVDSLDSVPKLVETNVAFLVVGKRVTTEKNLLVLNTQCSFIEVFTYVQNVFLRYRNWIVEMNKSVAQQSGLQDLFDISSGFLQNSVVAINPVLKLVAHTSDHECDDPLVRSLISNGYFTVESIATYKLNNIFNNWSKNTSCSIDSSGTSTKYANVTYSFKKNKSFSLVFMMVCDKQNPEPWLIDIFEIFLGIASYYALRDYSDSSPSGIDVATFINAIIDGVLNDSKEIESLRNYMGFSETGPYCLFYVNVPFDDSLSSCILNDIACTVAPAKVLLRDKAILILCSSCQGKYSSLGADRSNCPLAKSNAANKLNDIFATYGLVAGRSAPFEKFYQIPAAFKQAQYAYDCSSFGQLQSSGGTISHISLFDEKYYECLVAIAQRENPYMLFNLRSVKLLREISKYDLEHNSNNLEFLYYYIFNERRPLLVAEKMHMHRNNVKYRIDRIKELFDIDTDDEKQRLELIDAFRIRRTLSSTAMLSDMRFDSKDLEGI